MHFFIYYYLNEQSQSTQCCENFILIRYKLTNSLHLLCFSIDVCAVLFSSFTFSLSLLRFQAFQSFLSAFSSNTALHSFLFSSHRMRTTRVHHYIGAMKHRHKICNFCFIPFFWVSIGGFSRMKEKGSILSWCGKEKQENAERICSEGNRCEKRIVGSFLHNSLQN